MCAGKEVSGRCRDTSDSFLPHRLRHCTKETQPGPGIDKDLQIKKEKTKEMGHIRVELMGGAAKYLWTNTGPARFWFYPLLVNSLKLSQYCRVVCFQDFNVMFVSITREERNAWDVWQEEEMRLLDCRMITQPHLCEDEKKHQVISNNQS